MPPHFLVVARVDCARGRPPGAETTQVVRGLLCQVSPPRPRFSSEPLHTGALPPLRCGASTLLTERHHRATIFAAVCEGYLGMMPHWDLWLHLYRGELFHAPGGATGVRKPVRAGCLNLVQQIDKAEEPREYIPVGLTSNHAGWDSQWFYLRNDDNLFPDYTGRLISEHLDH